MTLTDLMSHSGLAIFAEVALLLFLAVFLVVVVRLFAPSRREEMEAAGRAPLDDHDVTNVVPPRPGARP